MKWLENIFAWFLIWRWGKGKPNKLISRHKDIALSPDIENYNREYCTFNPDNPPVVEFNGKKLPTYDDLLMMITNLIHQDCREVEHNVLRTTYIGVHDDALDMLEELGVLEKRADGAYKLDWMKLKPFENIHIFYKEKKKK